MKGQKTLFKSAVHSFSSPILSYLWSTFATCLVP